MFVPSLTVIFLDYVGVDPRVYPDFGVGPSLDALWGIGTLSFRASGAKHPSSHGDAVGAYVLPRQEGQIGSRGFKFLNPYAAMVIFWAVSCGPNTERVHGCAMGNLDRNDDQLLKC